MTMGQKIKELRKAKDLSQEQLALELEVTQASVSMWEHDESDPNLLNLMVML